MQRFIAQDAADREVEFSPLRLRVAWADERDTIPVDEIAGFGEAGLVAGAVESDVEHVKSVVRAKDNRVVDAARIERLIRRRGRIERDGPTRSKDQLRVLVRCTVGLDGVFCAARERRGAGSEGQCGLGEGSSSDAHGSCLPGVWGTRTATPCGPRLSVVCVGELVNEAW